MHLFGYIASLAIAGIITGSYLNKRIAANSFKIITEFLHIMSQINNKTNKNETIIIWFSRLLRWSLGVFFIAVGVINARAGGWPAILFGTLILITGFFKPKKCIGGCRIDQY